MLTHIPPPVQGTFRQTFMFSATMPTAVEKLANQFLRTPLMVQIGEVGTPVDRVCSVQRIPRQYERPRSSCVTFFFFLSNLIEGRFSVIILLSAPTLRNSKIVGNEKFTEKLGKLRESYEKLSFLYRSNAPILGELPTWADLFT